MNARRPGARRSAAAALAAAAALGAPLSAHAQLVTKLVDRGGATFGCVTVGPLAPIAQEYCVHRSLEQGAVLSSQRGESGLTVDGEGQVTAVRAGSAAERAGLALGDRLIAVADKSVREPAFQIAQRLTFKAAGQPVSLRLLRAGETIDRSYRLDRAPEPADAPRAPNPLIGMHPLMNWRGTFVPCMGAGPLGPVAIATCTSKMEHAGFVKTSALGDPGLAYDKSRPTEAVVASVTPASAAGAADIRPGDVVTAVDGRELTGDLPAYVATLLFGRIGEIRALIIERAGRRETLSLTLGPAAS